MTSRFYNAKKIFMILNPEFSSIFFPKKHMIGGNFPKKITIVSNGIKYKFIHKKYEGTDVYMMYDKKDDHHCIMILIDTKEKNAVIQGLSGDNPHCPNGSKLLRASIKFLKEKKDEFGIERIVLKDNSMKNCLGKNIMFGDMYTLLYGTTWYMAYGFLPYNQNTGSFHKIFVEKAKKNKQIVKNALVSDVKNLKKYIDKYAPKSNFDADKLNKKIDTLKNTKLSDFLKWLLKKYDDDTCILFYNIYEIIMADLGIQTLRGQSFYMKL